ncbi:AAA domain-domain-containing protein [Leucosporidium creatinivorum]|uniref:AAA domain-domain-containing protein n=1 Tax=Leucosporidium creatinivorum TaxID=106004 RepID=A0A1Y2F3X4_9BASI|nr:AAA domain-domain-containing protein [Leucosporidium creatinivorum]
MEASASSVHSSTHLSSAPQQQPAPQQLLILAGVVGSGKSTFSKALAKQLPNWSRVNQDDLGDRRACEAMVRSGLAAGKSVVVDRQNFDEAQRRTWLEIGTEFPGLVVSGLVMGTTEAECSQRLRVRQNHPTIDNPVLAAELLDKFLGMWSEPRIDEGFDYLMTLPSLPDTPFLTPELLSSLLLALLQTPRNPNGPTQRQPRPRQPSSYGYGASQRGGFAPRGGYGAGGARGGFAGAGQSWGAPQHQQQQRRGAPQQQSGGGGGSAWGGGGQQLGGRGGAPRGAWTGGHPHVWGGGGQTLGGGGSSQQQQQQP